MSTVGDRIQWILENCQISQRELARRAGFTASSQLNAIVRRLVSRPDSIELKTVKAIAHGAGVSERWLLTGDGRPSDGDAVHQGDLGPNLGQGVGGRERGKAERSGIPVSRLGSSPTKGKVAMMKYRCRTTKPKASQWFNIEAESPETAANSFHSKYDDVIDSVTYTPNPKLPGAFVHFAVVEVEGHGTWVSRVFLSRILRRGGAQRKPPPTIKDVALLLGYEHDPRTLLEDGWEGEEPETDPLRNSR